MPGYIFHLTEAEMIIRLLEKAGTISETDEEWKALFRVGNLLPDSSVFGPKENSHFWSSRDAEDIVRRPDLKSFTRRYQITVENPLLAGYYSHLHLDWGFLSFLIEKCVIFYDNNRLETKRRENAAYAFLCMSGKIVEIRQFFSSEYLYGDYTKMNHYFCRKYEVKNINEVFASARVLNMIEDTFEDIIKNTVENVWKGDCINQLIREINKFLVMGDAVAGRESQVISKQQMEGLLLENAEKIKECFGKESKAVGRV